MSKLGRGIVGLALTGLAGCTTAGQEFVNEVIEGVVVQGAVSSADAIARNEFEGPRGTNIENNFYTNNGRNVQLPENVIYRDGSYYPAEGYTWVDKGNNLEVRKLRKGDILKRVRNNYNGFPESEVLFYSNYVDDNNNNKWEPSEFKGIKDIFREDEEIRAVSFWEVIAGDLNGKAVTMDILGLDTNKMVYDFGEIERDPDNIIRLNETHLWGTNYNIPVNELIEKVGGRDYKVIFNLDGVAKKSGNFTIIPAQRAETEELNEEEILEEL